MLSLRSLKCLAKARALSRPCGVALRLPTMAMPGAEKLYGGRVEFLENPYQCAVGAEALFLVTEWN